MKRKFLLVLLALVSAFCLAFGIAACSSDDGGNENGNSGSSYNQNDANSGSANNSSTDNNSSTGESNNGDSNTESSGSNDSSNVDAGGGGNIPVAHVHNLTHTAAKESTCQTAGNIEYWYCSGCGKYYSDANATNEITTGVTLALGGHSYGEDGKCTVCNTAATESQNLVFTLSSDETYYTLSGIGTCTDTYIVVPATYNGKSVTEIASDLFYVDDTTTNQTITGVYIPASVTSIGSRAFYNCTALKSVVFAANSALTSIGDYAFYNCSALKSITLTESLTSIGSNAFYNSTALTTIDYRATALGDFSSSSGTPFIYAGQSGSGIAVSIASNVQSLPEYLFYASFSTNDSLPYITSIEFAENSVCTTIGEYAFGYTDISEIEIPDSVTTISEQAFYYCTSLKSVTFGENSALTTIGDRAFNSCSSLTSIVFPNGMTSISTGPAFGNCTSLMSVTLGTGLTSISSYSTAFINCYKLVEVYNFSSLTLTMGADSNGYVAKYAKVIHTSANDEDGLFTEGDFTFCKAGDNYYLMAYNGTDTDITMPDLQVGGSSVNYSVHQYALYENANITSVTMPSNVTSIGEYAFYNCTALTSVTIGSGVTSIGNYAFPGCYRLVEVYNLSSSLTITAGSSDNGDVAYFAKVIHTSASDESGLITEGDYTFYKDANGDYYLVSYNGTETELTLPDLKVDGSSVNYSINKYAFYKNANITSVTMPSYVTAIGNYAFDNCTSLESVTIGSGVTSIGNYAFNECSFTSLTIPDSVTTIGDYAFYKCSITSLTIPDSVTTIGEYAFAECSITSVIIPNSVTSMGNFAFYHCTKLTSVTLESGLTSISSYAFQSCTSLTSITIPASVTSIGRYAFYECKALASVTFENASGWYCSSDSAATYGTNLTLTNASTNAKYLIAKYNNMQYYSQYWFRTVTE